MRRLVFAHRGFHRDVPENTIDSFLAAARLGVDGIETDVRLDRHGTPILFHDGALPDGRLVHDLSREEISALVGYEVPSLAQALAQPLAQPLAVGPGLIWNIEIKTEAAAGPAAAILRDYVGSRRIIVSSFIHRVVYDVAGALGVEGGLLVSHCPPGPLLAAEALRPEIAFIVWHAATVDARALDAATAQGVGNMLYGFTSPAQHEIHAHSRVAAIITDFPPDKSSPNH